MARPDRIRIAAIAATPVIAMGALAWLTGSAYRPDYPDTPAVKIEGMDGPSVDLAAIQRSWPNGVQGRVAQERLHGFMEAIEAAPVFTTTAPVKMLEPEVDLGTRLARADISRGQTAIRTCASCHMFEPDGQNRIGPGLWGVVGRDIAGRPTFTYSVALATQPGNWTYEMLDRYLTNPARAVPGNKMAFAGIRKAQDRADVIAYLGSLSAQPLPYPPPQTAGAVLHLTGMRERPPKPRSDKVGSDD